MAKREASDALLRAAVDILRPIVQQMIASGVVFGQLESRLRELFVRIAEARFALPGRPQTGSRIAVLTGINRKEVQRIRASRPEAVEPTAFRRNLAADVVSRWSQDPRYSDRPGRPRPIPFRAKRGPSFVRLARETTRDLRPRALLDELVRTGMVELRDRNTVRLLADAYVPTPAQPEKLAMLAQDPPELIRTMIHNIFVPSDGLWLQQKVAYDNLGKEAAERWRAELRRRGERFLDEIDRALARYDRDRNAKAPGGARQYAGLGVYYFEAPEALPKKAKASRRRGEEER